MEKYQLYSPVQIECEMPYEPPWMLSDDYRLLTNSEKILCRDAVSEAMKRIKLCYQKSDSIQSKLHALVPDVEIKNGILTAVLTCFFNEPLTTEEQNSLAEWWKEECQHSYGRKLRMTRIKTKKFGRIWVFLKGV